MAGEVRVEASPVGPVVRPPDPADAVVLYLHGGQAMSAGPESALGLAERLALLTGATVVCPRYRSTFPAALEDAHAAYRYLRDAGRVVVAGERIGAGLAAALLVQLRDRGEALPRCAVLLSALLDLTMQAKSLLLNASAEATFDVAALRQLVTNYAGGAALTDSLLSPLYANLHGLPPIELLVSGTDPLLDDSLAFAARAAHSRVAVNLRVWEDSASLHAEAVTAIADFVTAWNPAARTDASSVSSRCSLSRPDDG